MTDTTTALSRGLAEAIASAAEATNLPRPERMKQHRKNLRGIAFFQGLDGVAQYKLEYPEAALIRVDLNAIAYSPSRKVMTPTFPAWPSGGWSMKVRRRPVMFRT